VPGVFLSLFEGAGFLGPFVGGPLVEEVLKPSGLLILLAARRRLAISRTTGTLLGALSGLTFALVENLIYFHVYHPAHSSEYVAYRSTVCVGLHMLCSSIVGLGLAWGRERLLTGPEEREHSLLEEAAPHLLDEPRERDRLFEGVGLSCLSAAVVIHALYNVAVSIFGTGID
jgi:RsiW-degrading membrane proteinase PrsW (M82 family)